MRYISDLASNALGNDLTQNLRRIIEASHPEDVERSLLKLSESLEKLLSGATEDRAREVVVLLIGHVNKVYTELRGIPALSEFCEEIAPIILKTVIPPSVNKLECIPYYPHRELPDYYEIKDSHLIYKSLPLLSGLTELSIGMAERSMDLKLDVRGFADTLQKFSSRSCQDGDVRVLAENCKQLKCLDISFSTDISDEVTEYILRFKYLEELDLSADRVIRSSAADGMLKRFNSADDQEETGPPLGPHSTAAPAPKVGPARRKKLLKFGCNRAGESTLKY